MVISVFHVLHGDSCCCQAKRQTDEPIDDPSGRPRPPEPLDGFVLSFCVFCLVAMPPASALIAEHEMTSRSVTFSSLSWAQAPPVCVRVRVCLTIVLCVNILYLYSLHFCLFLFLFFIFWILSRFCALDGAARRVQHHGRRAAGFSQVVRQDVDGGGERASRQHPQQVKTCTHARARKKCAEIPTTPL